MSIQHTNTYTPDWKVPPPWKCHPCQTVPTPVYAASEPGSWGRGQVFKTVKQKIKKKGVLVSNQPLYPWLTGK
jgi:hypothetical protein